MKPVNIVHPAASTVSPSTLAVYLGSFDPPHRGHIWIMERTLCEVERLLVLIPTSHFEKKIQVPQNALIEQRLQMLCYIQQRYPERIALGTTDFLLFVQLCRWLQRSYAHEQLFLTMGTDTYHKMLDSKRYYSVLGIPWQRCDQHTLNYLKNHTILFARSPSQHIPGSTLVPKSLQSCSSTRIRRWFQKHVLAKGDTPLELAKQWLPDSIFRFILQHQLYQCIDHKNQ